MKITTAYCWATGLIELGPTCPPGALPLLRGDAGQVKQAVDTLAVHGYDGVTRKVPGCGNWGEGKSQGKAVDDVSRFAKRLWSFMAKEDAP